MSVPILVFDIETVPDVATGKRLYPEIATLPDEQALTALIALREQEANTPFMRLPLHKIACLSMLWVDNGSLTLKSFSLDTYSEMEILSKFFGIFEKGRLPNLVSWNGSRFDIPVMLYRAIHHKLVAPHFLDETSSNEKRYNNYLGRYHARHLDLMDKMSLYGTSLHQPLDVVATLCGFAGKQDLDGSQVVTLVQNNDWKTLTTYCESDVLNTWLVYLRWQRLSGGFSPELSDSWEEYTRGYLQQLTDDTNEIRHQKFLDGWQA